MSNLASASSHQTTADVVLVNNRPKASGADTAPNLAALHPVETLDAERSVVQNVVYAINYTVDMAVVVVVATAEASTTQQVAAVVVAVDFMTVAAVVAAVDFMVVMTAASLDMVAANFLAAAKPKVDTVVVSLDSSVVTMAAAKLKVDTAVNLGNSVVTMVAAKLKVDTVANLGTAAASFLVVARSSVVAHNSAVQAELTLKKQ